MSGWVVLCGLRFHWVICSLGFDARALKEWWKSGGFSAPALKRDAFSILVNPSG